MEINWKTEKKQIMVERMVNVVDSITLSSKECEILSILSIFADEIVEAIENYAGCTRLTAYAPNTNVESSHIHGFLSELSMYDLFCDGVDLTTKDSDTINSVIDMNDTHEDKPIINVGDRVKVVRKTSPVNWDNCWVGQMDQYIGDTFDVLQTSKEYGYKLGVDDVGDDWWWFPFESLEKVI